MEFEDLQKIWDTQNERPVFAMDDNRLVVGLYQQRERRRQQLFRKEFAPIYFTMPLLALFAAFTFVAFYFKTVTRMRTTDPLMSVWDGVALVVGLGAAIAIIALMHAERKKHERTQKVFAPSLREELELGISQLDFQLSLCSTRRVITLNSLVAIGSSVILWESARLNGNPVPWGMLGYSLLAILFVTWIGLASRKKTIDRVMQRRRALESMRAALEEVR